MRPLTFLRATASLGRWESAIGPAMSRANVATDISEGLLVTGTLGKCPGPHNVPGQWHFSGSRVQWTIGESASCPAISRATEATDISQGHRVSGPLGKCQGPGNIPDRTTEASEISQGHRFTGPLGRCQWPDKVPGHWGHWQIWGSLGHRAIGKMPVARQCHGPLRPLTFLRVTESLGGKESASGPAMSQATEVTDISQDHWVTGTLGKCQWPGPLRPLTFLRATGTLGKCQWPGNVPSHWGHWHISGSLGHLAVGKVPVARQCPGPLRLLTFLRVTGSLDRWESGSGPAISWATEASRGHWHFSGWLGHWAVGKVPVASY